MWVWIYRSMDFSCSLMGSGTNTPSGQPRVGMSAAVSLFRPSTQITRSGAGKDSTLVTQVADHIGGTARALPGLSRHSS